MYAQSYGNSSYSVGPSRIGPRDFKTKDYSGKKVQAVIVTISDSNSYDSLFKEIEQTAPKPDEEYVSVFQMSSQNIPPLLEYLKNGNELHNETLNQIAKEITSIEGDCVVFNWECCEGCSHKAFPIESQLAFEFVKQLLDRKMVCMFSDFSLKALIAQWNEKILGPNPFVQVGEFGSSFDLEFSPQTLLDCPSAQLQKVGELCTNGKATVHALGGTILYQVKPNYATPHYELAILTQVSSAEGIKKEPKLAGHVTVSYPSGGIILTSCGHWIELVKLDISVDNMLKAAEKQYGSAYSEELRQNYNQAADKDSFAQGWSRNYVQSAAPCNYSSNSKW